MAPYFGAMYIEYTTVGEFRCVWGGHLLYVSFRGSFGVALIFGGCVCVRTVNGNGFRDFFPHKQRLNDGGVETMSCNGCGKRVE
jgi:hypothetical protein